MEVSSQLQSWSQAFEDHPIVQTRTIEKQLRADIAHNKQKLRNLVGGSYRGLLATAEQIVALDGKTTSVEGQISELGRNCRPKQYLSASGDASKHSEVAQLSLLHRCSSCIASCLKAGQIILAAKLLAISRLLHTSLSKREHPPHILETLLDQLSRLRRRLLRRIDRRLDDADIEQNELTQIICAFCLATSSSSNDAIHHFQHRRLGHIRHSAQGAHGDHQHTVKTFKYYIDSLRTTKLLLGHDIPRALRKLQQTAILEDIEIMKLEHLNLSTLRILMPAEIRSFTPYIKRSELSELEATNLLEKWSSEAFTAVQSQLITHLKTLDDSSVAFTLRKDVLSTWLPVCFSTHAHANLVEVLRGVLNEHIESLLQSQVSILSAISMSFINSSTEPSSQNLSSNPKTNTTNTVPALWSPTLSNTPLTRSTMPFLNNLRTASLVSTPSLVTFSQNLSTWCLSISVLQTSIETLQKIRWQDIVEDPDDSDDSDEDSAKNIIQHLSSDDAQSYAKTLTSALDSSLRDFQTAISTAALATTTVDSALHFLRGIREMAIHLSASFPSTSLKELQTTIPHPHGILANEIVRRLTAETKMRESNTTMTTTADKNKNKRKNKQPDTFTLPENLPSPTAFHTLRSLCKIMLQVGETDTWTGPAVQVVKYKVAASIFSHEEDSEAAGGEKYYNYCICNAFDAAYLAAALGWQGAREMNAVHGVGTADEKLTNSVKADEEVTKKEAIAYWERTRLLFGVLDP